MKLTVMIEVVDPATGGKGRQVKSVDLPPGMTAQLESFYGQGAAPEVATQMMQAVMGFVMGQAQTAPPPQPQPPPQVMPQAQPQGYPPVQVGAPPQQHPQFPGMAQPQFQRPTAATPEQATPAAPYMIEDQARPVAGPPPVTPGMRPHEYYAAVTDPNSMLHVSKLMIQRMVGGGEERTTGPGHIGGSMAKPGLNFPTGQRRQ